MNAFQRAVTVTVAALLCLALAGCLDREESSLFSAVGSYGDVAVLASSPNLYLAAAPALDLLSPDRTFILKEEETYRFADYSGKNWKDGRNYRNLLFLVRWGDGGPVEKELAGMLSESARARLQGGRGGLVTIHDPYYRNQLAIVVAAPQRDDVTRLLRRHAAALGDTLRRDIDRRIRRDHRREGIHTAAVPHLWARHGFWLEVPVAYPENQTEPDGYPGIEWLRSEGATRGLTVTWHEAEEPDRVLRDRDRLLAIRAELGETLHGERLVPESLDWGEDTLAGLPAVRLRGAWASDEVSVGGPFECFFLADRPRERVFCLDLLVYAPDREKMDDFRRLRAIAETFSLQPPPE